MWWIKTLILEEQKIFYINDYSSKIEMEEEINGLGENGYRQNEKSREKEIGDMGGSERESGGR